MWIQELQLYTTNIERCREFYTTIIGLQEQYFGNDRLEYRIGNSILIFQQATFHLPYHIAISYPPDLEAQCLKTSTEKLDILPGPNGDKVIDFNSWNSRSIYFKDPDGNVMEWIGRRDIDYDYSEKFDGKSLQNINEVGMVVHDLPTTIDKLKNIMGLKIYSGSSDEFCAIGDKHGLLIIINKRKKTWFPTEIETEYADLQFVIRNNDKPMRGTLKSGVLKLSESI